MGDGSEVLVGSSVTVMVTVRVFVPVGSGVQLGVGVSDGIGDGVLVGVIVAVNVGVKVGYLVGIIFPGVEVTKGVDVYVAVRVDCMVRWGSFLCLILTKAYPNP